MEEKTWKDHYVLLNKDEENELEAFGYKTQGCRKALCIAGYILSCGALLLLFYWKPEWDVWANCVPCSLEEADVILLRTTDEFQKYTQKKVIWIDLSTLAQPVGSNSECPLVADKDSVINRAVMKPQLKMRYIQVQKIRYIWDFSVKEFRKVGHLVCGPNAIEVEICPIWKLLFKEQSTKLHDLVEEHNKVQVTVCTKNEGFKELESRYLVPGDVFLLDGKKLSLPCDAVLIDGSCIVNEGMLTGESIPVMKTLLPLTESPEPWKTHSMGDYRRHVLFCGTEVIQAKSSGRGPVRAVVLQTGFNTAKGDLVRSILYPRPVNFQLYRDAFKFIVGLSAIGVLGSIYTVCVFTYHRKPVADVVAMALLLLTAAVPPAIPAALTTGTVYAQRRLKKKKIFCITPQRINICGQINLVCFDKELEESSTAWDQAGAIGACIVRPGPNASSAPVEGIAILHQFPFSSGLQRMSVVSQKIGEEQYDLYMKGAPETVSSFCRQETVPADFLEELKAYTSQGFRVIALAHKVLSLPEDVDVCDLEREEAESGLEFLGLLMMENRLKPETKPVLRELAAAHIRSIMVTGDNLQTAVTVARSADMIHEASKVIIVEASKPEGSTPASIAWRLAEGSKASTAAPSVSTAKGWLLDAREVCANTQEKITLEGESCNYHFAMNGKSYQVLTKHFYSLLPKALKMAHAGISLSEQEASVASPFTSQIPNIQCVPELIREGRAALVASFAVVKYLTLYGLIQFVGTALLFWQLQIFGNYQYLVQDVITLLVCLTMSLTEAYPKLAPYRPPGQLISPPLLLSVVLNVCFTIAMQTCGFLLVKKQPWYVALANWRHRSLGNQTLPPAGPGGNGTSSSAQITVLSYEGTTLWLLSTINCIIVAFVFSKGKPFRKPIYTNYVFSALLTLQLAFCLFLFFADVDVVYSGMQDVLLQNKHLWMLIKACTGYQSKSQYRKWQQMLQRDPNWPPVNTKDFAARSTAEVYINPSYEHRD
ncbi:hypothetical protein ASZ78_014737 [Callipepla squamata]|uniref:Cation-transporting ATPase n=1 Tax=Callipepla squamata TaxID=9009 RepID=A0A226N8N5_CALSU|nr:hypothetical protein ASZ78_014737 [Callipepla squamata]